MYALLKIWWRMEKVEVLVTGSKAEVISERDRLQGVIDGRGYGVSYTLTYRRVG